ncbi:MAG: HNH endonuclease signature motif containing protein [Candidatus Eremiobacteraeota bacterium]|nr:HNH endonuclease signature motif containing protein [Candidatus Eremiobacteraeota bacterium]
MDTFETHTTHSLFLPDEEELLYLADPCCLHDHEDLLLLPEPYELPEGTLYKPEHIVKITREGLIPEAERLTGDITWGPPISTISRDERAARVDFTLCEAVRGRLALDLTIGGLLVNLKTKGVDHLGYRSIGSFAVEHLSFSGRTASELMRNFELLSSLPLTREAYLQGKIARSALRHLLRVVTPENEAEWLERAQKLSVSGLERDVKKALGSRSTQMPCSGEKGSSAHCDTAESGIASDGDEADGTMMHFSVSPTLALTWDFTLSFFRDKEHYDGPIAGFVEALLANWIGSGKSALCLSPLDDKGSLPIFSRVPLLPRRMRNHHISDPDAVNGQVDERQAATGDNPWESPWSIFFPSWLEEMGSAGMSHPKVAGTASGFSIDAGPVRDLAGRLIRAAMIRQRLDAAIGMLLRAMEARKLHHLFGFDFIEDYAREWCGFSMAQTRQLIRLAEGFGRHSLTEDAFKKGTITREQARLILPLVDSRNESQWIAYAASVPTVDLREEARRCARILEYDCLVSHSYNLLPGFRYLTDERFHSLSPEVQDIIRDGSWYMGPSLASSWPLSSDDEELMLSRDRRFEEPWKHFSDVDEMLACEAGMKIEKNSTLCAGPEVVEKAREACTIPQGASPEETFLVDILPGGTSAQKASSVMMVKFFLPADLYEVWNMAALAFLHTAAEESTETAIGLILPEERFLASLLADYLATEGEFRKAAHHHRILRRDRFRCQAPGCRCRRNLHVHHIIRRSQGGTDNPWNLITLCEACHLHLLHGLGTLSVRGKAPLGLTFIFGSLSDGEPFLVYEKGVKIQEKQL